jgi:hypothetical protein
MGSDRTNAGAVDDGAGGARPTPTAERMPRWVKITGIVTAVAVALLIIAMATGLGGQHGPGRHQAPALSDQQAPAPSTGSAGELAPGGPP